MHDRTVLTDADVGADKAPLISGGKGDRGVTAGDLEPSFPDREAVLWRRMCGRDVRGAIFLARFGKVEQCFPAV